MPKANWSVFSTLPGAADENFERLCRSLVLRHYGPYGRFKQLANQPGVEFHLQLLEPCALGAPPRWFGWQCKWFELASGQDLGATRREAIFDSLGKTRKYLPGLTDWRLWTRHTLTKGDQAWFYALEESHFPGLKLGLLTSADIEDLLAGPGALLRETYFGELVLTPTLLAEQYKVAAAPFNRRFLPDVHVVVGAEKDLLRCLGDQGAREPLQTLSGALRRNCTDIGPLTEHLKAKIKVEIDLLIDRAAQLAEHLESLYAALGKGDLDTVKQMMASTPLQPIRYDGLLSRLRGTRSEGAPLVANLVADIHAVASALRSLDRSIGTRAIAILAGAGEGKSELAVKTTQATGEFPGGVLLLGKNLRAAQRLDDLVSAFKISGKPVESFDRLVEAVDAAGRRARRRIPVVIDGLNEAEDPRDWRDELSRADELLKRFPYVLLVVTLRNPFAEMCLPSEFPQLEHHGFREDPQAAIDRYFRYYKIDGTDADLPIELLWHPLTLKIFCEVANHRHQHIVGVEALPSSLVNLFEAHITRVAERIAELSPTARRVYQHEVEDALLTIAGLLWEANARSVEFRAAQAAIGDSGPWDTSLIRALESEGILVRAAPDKRSHGVSFSYDLMAGHLIARYLLGKPAVEIWLQSTEGCAHLDVRKPDSHTFAYDVFPALVGLYPQRSHRRQLWQDLLDESLVVRALLLTAESDPRHIGRETAERFARAMRESREFSRLAFKRLWSTRAARAHPFDMDFLHGVLLAMSNTQRDLFWSEWIREKSEEVENDFKFLSTRWESGSLDERELRRARWVMWTLTSTSRKLRDLATKILYEFAAKRPADFFQLASEAIAVSDPYVPERMFAAAYGAALVTWSDSNAVEMREALPIAARDIYGKIFSPAAAHPTWHALYQQYCLGTIAIARLMDSACLSEEELAHLLPPLSHLRNPFENGPPHDPAAIESAKRTAIRMDFGNYTIGRLVPGRSNYDDRNPEYQRVLRSIVSRMLMLGYDPNQFETVDRKMSSGPRIGNDKNKVDRYGKKYGWIAYFEMWGLRYAQGLLAEDRSARPPDADIDPTFPPKATIINLALADVFSDQPASTDDWIVNGPQPDYRSIVEIESIDGLIGPWVLLDGFVKQNAPNDDRQIFTFLRGVLVDRGDVDHLCALFTSLKYPGNDAIPEEPIYYYSYAGEMPFSSNPGLPASEAEEQEGDAAESMVSAERWPRKGVSVDIPVQKYNWESYHSVVNQSGSANLPSKRLCEALDLRYRANTWDLHDASGVASLYREVGEHRGQSSGSFSYLRRDLLDRYLTQSGKALVWLMWGERGLHFRSSEVHKLHKFYAAYNHIHKRTQVYQPDSGNQS